MQEPANRFTYRMKKLFLTSFEFTTGDNRYKEQRLVMVQSNELGADQTHEDVAYQKINRWFPVNYPESKLISIIAHPTITGYAEDNVIRNKNNEAFAPIDKVFDASWNKGTVIPEDIGDEMSDEFLVDVSGFREVFVIGWYDHGLKKWQCEASLGYQLNGHNLMYQRLPLSKYDNLD